MSLVTEPAEIEKRSFGMIDELLGGKPLAPENAAIIKRVIHTTADFDYADNLFFSEGAAAAAKEALKKGAQIVTDTEMAKAGVNKKAAESLGTSVHCFIGDREVAETALAGGSTRARAAVDRAVEALASPGKPLIFAVGNAPTALVRLHELICAKRFAPAFLVAAPVGFVNVLESKELILGLDGIPRVVARGRKGGSNVAAAICNALLYEAVEEGKQG